MSGHRYKSKETRARELMSTSRGIRDHFAAQATAAAATDIIHMQPEEDDTERADGSGADNVIDAGRGTSVENEVANEGDEGGGDTDAAAAANEGVSDEDREYWPPDVDAFFRDIRTEIDEAVKLSGKGSRARFEGQVPQRFRQLFKPSEDPEAHFSGNLLDMKHFMYPHILVWFPEALHQRYYPTARPPCKWHGCHECVTIEGWVSSPRHCYGLDRVHALIGKRYKCKRKERAGDECYFRGYDQGVISNSPDYIKMLWKKVGYDISHRSAIAWNVLETLQAQMLQSLSVSGFRRHLLEAAKNYHMRLSIQWRSYVDSLTTLKSRTPYLYFVTPQQIKSKKQYLHEFDSKEYGQTIPSLKLLMSRVLLLLEREAEYWNKRMQGTDGKHLSGDHSFKLAKCVLSNRSKPFTAMYTLMNEFGQVVGWWFTTGTGMNELNECLMKLKHRYELLGFEGPLSFTTDRCCQDRTSLETTLALNSVADPDVDDTDIQGDRAGEEDESTEVFEVVSLPSEPRLASTSQQTDLFVAEISRHFMENSTEIQVMGMDTEYHRGQYKAKCLQIALPNGTTYIFHLASICKRRTELPRSLKMLLENEAVGKVGNRVHNDVKSLLAWNVEVRGTIELGHVANDRALCGRAPSLGFLVELLWPGVILEGKDGSGPRVGDWNSLTPEKIRYAAIDAYSTISVYQRLMQIMQPKEQQKLLVADIQEGLPVTIYASGWKHRVAEATLVGRSNLVGLTRHVRVKLDLGRREKIYAPGTFVNVIQQNNEPPRREAISALCLESNESVLFDWPQHFCRRTTDVAEANEVVKIKTEQKCRHVEVERDATNNQMDESEDDADIDTEDNNASDSSTGFNNLSNHLPRTLRQRLRKFRVSAQLLMWMPG